MQLCAYCILFNNSGYYILNEIQLNFSVWTPLNYWHLPTGDTSFGPDKIFTHLPKIPLNSRQQTLHWRPKEQNTFITANTSLPHRIYYLTKSFCHLQLSKWTFTPSACIQFISANTSPPYRIHYLIESFHCLQMSTWTSTSSV